MLHRHPTARPVVLAALCGLLGTIAAAPVQAQAAEHWTLRTRVAMSGSSDHSEPAGFTIYSGVALETALSRRLGRGWAMEAAVRNESREVDRERTTGSPERLGSLELLPMTLTLQRHFRSEHRFRPYLGAGTNLTVAWEKSGVLDSLDVTAHLGPVVQLGADWGLSPSAMVNVELRWQTLALAIDGPAGRYTRLQIHPLTLGAGLGFRF